MFKFSLQGQVSAPGVKDRSGKDGTVYRSFRVNYMGGSVNIDVGEKVDIGAVVAGAVVEVMGTVEFRFERHLFVCQKVTAIR